MREAIMPGIGRPGSVPLPRNWPPRVRSAAVHAIAFANLSFTRTLTWAADGLNLRLRRQAELERLRREISLLREEIRIKDARMEQIEPHRRPYYPPAARLEILELRAARGWSLAQTARTFLVNPLTIASWTGRLNEEGPEALVRLPVPVNRFPDFVGYLVKRLKFLCPSLGKVRIAQVLARAGLHLAPTTVRRMLQGPRPPKARAALRAMGRVVTARHPNQLWHVDLTTVPTALGFWIPWVPFARPQVWPFCWWVALAIDHFSRRVMGFAVFRGEPTSVAIQQFLEGVFRRVGQQPQHLISDQGIQFTAKGFWRWCRRRGIQHRFGAVGRYGSIAVIERYVRTLKTECTRRLILVPYRLASFRRELALYASWYNGHRPHTWLRGATPDEVYNGRRWASRMPRFEPRLRWPRRSRCAAPQVLVRSQPGIALEIDVQRNAGRLHLPVVTLRRAA
jgi:transposase InsO family protein